MKPTIPIADYSYNLEEQRIAKFPLVSRDCSKLLVYHKKNISEDVFGNINTYIPSNSLLIFNNTKVIHARFFFTKESGAKIEIFCLEPLQPALAEQALAAKECCKWLCTVGNLKRWKSEPLTLTYAINNEEGVLTAEKVEQRGPSVLVRFSWTTSHSFGQLMDAYGQLPIPPYLKRATEVSDEQTYQTVYAKHEGSVAAPTAGLHFTDNVIESLKQRNIECEELTLHVGAGTFKPVKAETIDEHEMHREHFTVTRNLLERIAKKLNAKEPIVAVGTTSVRTLESLYYLGCKVASGKYVASEQLEVEQWEPYNENDTEQLTAQEAINALISYLTKAEESRLAASTSIMIVPGYRFKLINGLVTNFHQPQSTLLLLVAAFIGEESWRKVYSYALQNSFRFLSYGDSSILLP